MLNERIQAFVQKPDTQLSGATDYAAEFSQLKIENDLVSSFFDEIHKMSDAFTFNFVETLKQDVSSPKLSFLNQHMLDFYLLRYFDILKNSFFVRADEFFV